MDASLEKLKKIRWMYLALGVVLLLFLGLIYAWSVFRAPLAEEFGWSPSQLSVTFSISMMMFCIGGFFSGIITAKKGYRLTMVLCAVSLAAGFIFASRISTLMGIYMTYGLLCGLGVGLGYNVVISTVVKWFPDRQGFVSGVSLMGFGFGGMLLGTAGAKMIAAMGWRTTFLIFGIAFGIIVIVCMLLMRTAPQEFVDSMLTGSKKAEPSVEELEPVQMLKRRNFWVYFVWAIVLSAAGLAIINDAAPFVQTIIGDDLTRAAAIAGIISIFNGVGRVLVGLIYDRFNYRVTMILTDLLFLLSAAALIGCFKSGSYVLLIIAFALIGTSYGFVPPTNSAFIAYFFGRKNYGINFSLINMNLIIASYLGPLCGGGDYMRSFYFIIGFAVIGFVLTLLIKKPQASQSDCL